MKVRVRLFSLLRDRAGTASAELELPPGADVGAAVERLAERHPALGRLLEPASGLPVRFALNREYAERGARLRDGDEVALFPPVSGGAGPGPIPDLGRGLLLLSGGFDSPVAGHVVHAGGHPLDAIHFTMEPFTDDASARKAQALAASLAIDTLTIIPLGADLAELTRRCEHRYYFVLLKRLMLRVAEGIAARAGARFLVTGENLGQVSSQTLANLAAIEGATRLPVLRPLLGLDKNDIIRIAQRIGTYETSKGPELCDLLGPRHPTTAADPDAIRAEEAKLDLGALVAGALARAYVAGAPTLRNVAA